VVFNRGIYKVDGKTHFFKSWEEKDGKINLLDAIKRTSAAPYYFKHIKENKNIWLDGGTGNSNAPIIESIVDAIRLGWIENEDVYLLSLGTGHSDKITTVSKANKYGTIGDVLFYLDPINGGLARNQSIEVRVNLVKSLQCVIDNFTFQRVDTVIDKKLDKIDKVKYVREYEKIGKSLIDNVNINILRK
jgi:hypothetical protein